MGAVVVDGKALGLNIQDEVRKRAAALGNLDVSPHLAVLIAGDDPASQVYVRNKERACERCGIASTRIDLPSKTSLDEILEVVDNLNSDSSVHGILVQSPAPDGVDELAIAASIDPQKDD